MPDRRTTQTNGPDCHHPAECRPAAPDSPFTKALSAQLQSADIGRRTSNDHAALKFAPLGKGCTVQLEILAAVEMVLPIEMIVYG
jgi:hypothetical protein